LVFGMGVFRVSSDEYIAGVETAPHGRLSSWAWVHILVSVIVNPSSQTAVRCAIRYPFLSHYSSLPTVCDHCELLITLSIQKYLGLIHSTNFEHVCSVDFFLNGL